MSHTASSRIYRRYRIEGDKQQCHAMAMVLMYYDRCYPAGMTRHRPRALRALSNLGA